MSTAPSGAAVAACAVARWSTGGPNPVHTVKYVHTEQIKGKELLMLYCLIHGHTHNEWERDDVLLIGDELPCIEEDWPVVAGAVVSSTTQAPDSEAYFLLSPGQLAYIQSRHAGMVPCKVQRISETHAHVKVTAARAGFPRGVDVILAIPTMTLVSRHQVYVEHKQVRALGPTRFATDDGVLV